MRAAIFLPLLLAALPALALDVSDRARFECKQGNCINGPGVVWDAVLSVYMHGNWSNGKTIPGATYTLTAPIAPGRQFKQVYGQDGMLDSGEQPRTLGATGGVMPVFRGTYGRTTHAFLRQRISVITQGVYDTGVGIEYRGRFEYLSAKSGMRTGWASGYFIFYGDRIDTEEDEKETGLYISDETPGGAQVRFVKADPSYLAVLQRKYQSDMALAQGEFQEQEAEKKWRSALSVIGNVAFALAAGNGGMGGMGGGGDFSGTLAAGLMAGGQPGSAGLGALGAMAGGGGGGASGSDLAGSIAMGLVSGMFNQGGDVNVGALASQAIGAAVGADNSQLGNMLIGAVTQGLLDGGAQGGAGATNAFADAMINRTTNVIATAGGSKGSGSVGGQIAAALLKEALTPAAPTAAVTATTPRASTPAALQASAIGATVMPGERKSDDLGTVQLPYTPGKGFLDPVTGKYIKTMEEMSCDNVTTRGIRIRDLPPEQRVCVDYRAPVVNPAPGKPADRATSGLEQPQPGTKSTAPAPGSKTKAGAAKSSASVGVIPARDGMIAQLDKVDPPPGMKLRVGRMYGTNDGVYLAADDSDGNTVVLKRTLGRGSPAGWLQARLPPGSATFAISSLANEGVNAFGIHWATYAGRYGYTNMNNEGTSVDYKNEGAHAFVPVGAKSTTGRNWAIGGASKTYLKNTGGGQSTDFSARYADVTPEGMPGLYKDLAVTDEEGSTLYAVAGDLKTLLQVTQNRKFVAHDLSPFGQGHIHTLVAGYGKIWVGYGDQIITLAGGKLTPFLTLQTAPLAGPAFCFAGRSLYASDGRVMHQVDLPPSAPRSFLEDGRAVRMEDMIALSEMKAALLLGLACADSPGYGPVIYALGANTGEIERRLFLIRPR